jgi:hypothetical protein
MMIILTLGRSGSSLIMQTLKHLGCNVIGRQFDSHDDPGRARRHRELNPGGYFEEPDIYYGGAKSVTFQEALRVGSDRQACKMDLRHFWDPDQASFWKDAASLISAIIISYRHPAEQAHSEYLGSGLALEDPDARAQFLFLAEFLRTFTKAYGGIIKRDAYPCPSLLPKIHLVGHHTAGDPDAFVQRLQDIACLAPYQEQVALARSNISADLVRTRATGLDEQELDWAARSGAIDVFQTLAGQAGQRMGDVL